MDNLRLAGSFELSAGEVTFPFRDYFVDHFFQMVKANFDIQEWSEVPSLIAVCTREPGNKEELIVYFVFPNFENDDTKQKALRELCTILDKDRETIALAMCSEVTMKIHDVRKDGYNIPSALEGLPDVKDSVLLFYMDKDKEACYEINKLVSGSYRELMPPKEIEGAQFINVNKKLPNLREHIQGAF